MSNVTVYPEVVALTERVKILRERVRSAQIHCCAERSRLITEAWRETEGEALDIRWARMFEKVLKEQTVSIRDGELIVGSQTKYILGASPSLNFDADLANVLRSERFSMRRDTEAAVITEEERRSLLQDGEWWTGKSVCCQTQKRWDDVLGDKSKDIESSVVIRIMHSAVAGAVTADYPKVLAKGLRGIIDEAKKGLDGLTFTQADDLQKYNFFRAVVIALEAMICFAHRHAVLARELAERESDVVRRRELRQIAEACERVPEHPARTFREALQSFRFIHLGLNLERGGFGEQPSRMDQWLYPFYERDLREGRLTRSEAAELLGCLWVKFNEMTQFKNAASREQQQGEQMQYVVIAGVTPDGKDATNELSYLILDVVRQLTLPQPAVALRYHPDLSEDFLMQAIETNRVTGSGIPVFINDGRAIPGLLSLGVSPEDAREVEFHGCVQVGGPATGLQVVALNLNAPKMFELALHNGVDPRIGKQIGPATGDPRRFQTFEELVDAFKTQYTYWVELGAKANTIALLTKCDMVRLPFLSAFVKDCISRGKDYFSGGVRYPQFLCPVNARGLQNVANSLAAIKKLVFEEKKISMDKLLEAIDRNFEGQEELRCQLLAAPKWGNDDDEVDALHAHLWDWTGQVSRRAQVNPFGVGPAMVVRGGATWHYVAGKVCGALADGRKAGQPMGDGNVSAVAGTDHKGPTAVINSAMKLNQAASTSSLFNLKFPPSIFESEENKRKLLTLIRTYFDRGDGYQIQFNMIDRETLLDAKRHPEKHRDLLVRVAGFSTFFVDLEPLVQDDIIARIEQNF